jgi:hypothetical protein
VLRKAINAGESWQEIKQTRGLGKRHTMSAIQNRARALGLKVRNGRWTAAEDDLLLAGLSEGKDPVNIAKELPGRKVKAVKVRAARLMTL